VEQDIATGGVDLACATSKTCNFFFLQLVEQRHVRQQRFDVEAVLSQVHGRFPKEVARSRRPIFAFVIARGKLVASCWQRRVAGLPAEVKINDRRCCRAGFFGDLLRQALFGISRRLAVYSHDFFCARQV